MGPRAASGLCGGGMAGGASGPGCGEAAFVARETPGCGVAAFALHRLLPGDVALEEPALFTSSAAAPGGRGMWEALVQVERSRKLPAFTPATHLGALIALRDLGPSGVRKLLLTKCAGPEEELPTPRSTKRDAAAMRLAVKEGLVPAQAGAALSPGEYARLRKVVQMNGFRFNGQLCEGELGYDVGEVVFDKVSRINHSCAPNLQFDVSWSEEHKTVMNRVTATQEIMEGEEICISYLPLSLRLPVAERRRQLRQNWGFDCGCQCCVAEGGAGGGPAAGAPATAGGGEDATGTRDEDAASCASSGAGIAWDDLCDPNEAVPG